MRGRPPRLSVPVLVGAAVAAVVIAGGLYALLTGNGNDAFRGEIVYLAAPEPGSEEPVCPEGRDFCLVATSSGLPRALYLYDTHQRFRDQGCPVAWEADFSFTDPETQEQTQGWFVSPCSGATYRLDGTHVFGPGQRNMDQFPLFLHGDEVEVRTGLLICGRSPDEEDCDFAPSTRPE